MRAPVLDQRLGGPGQHVDEAGRDGEAGGVDLEFRTRVAEVPDRRDDGIVDGDVGYKGFTAAAVVDGAPPENHVIFGGLGVRSQEAQ